MIAGVYDIGRESDNRGMCSTGVSAIGAIESEAHLYFLGKMAADILNTTGIQLGTWVLDSCYSTDVGTKTRTVSQLTIVPPNIPI